MKINFNLLFIKLLVLLASLLLSTFSYAEDWEGDAEPAVTAHQSSENKSMPWSLLAGESLNDVARLFYPNNKLMQRRFVEKSMQLSRYIQPDLNPAHRADVDIIIVIPNIKYLTPPKVKQSVKPTQSKIKRVQKVNVEAEFSPALQAAYDELFAKNLYLKQELEKLNAKLAHLLVIFTVLKVELMRVLNETVSVPVTGSTAPAETVNDSTLFAPATANQGREPQNSWYLMLPILSVLFVMSLFLMLGLHKNENVAKVNKRYSPNFYSKMKYKYGKIVAKLFTRDSVVRTKKSPVIYASDFPIEPVAKSEYSGSMIVSDLTDVGIPGFVVDGELVLEQAKIYIDIKREDIAINLLKTQIQAAPKAAIEHWLLLLDIYRKNNQKEEFMQYAKLLHEHFNVMMPSWDNITLPAAIATSLEQFEHISKKMIDLWENCEKEAGKIAQTKRYLDELMMDNRANERAGFSLDVFKEILLLRAMLDTRQKLAFTA